MINTSEWHCFLRRIMGVLGVGVMLTTCGQEGLQQLVNSDTSKGESKFNKVPEDTKKFFSVFEDLDPAKEIAFKVDVFTFLSSDSVSVTNLIAKKFAPITDSSETISEGVVKFKKGFSAIVQLEDSITCGKFVLGELKILFCPQTAKSTTSTIWNPQTELFEVWESEVHKSGASHVDVVAVGPSGAKLSVGGSLEKTLTEVVFVTPDQLHQVEKALEDGAAISTDPKKTTSKTAAALKKDSEAAAAAATPTPVPAGGGTGTAATPTPTPTPTPAPYGSLTELSVVGSDLLIRDPDTSCNYQSLIFNRNRDYSSDDQPRWLLLLTCDEGGVEKSNIYLIQAGGTSISAFAPTILSTLSHASLVNLIASTQLMSLVSNSDGTKAWALGMFNSGGNRIFGIDLSIANNAITQGANTVNITQATVGFNAAADNGFITRGGGVIPSDSSVSFFTTGVDSGAQIAKVNYSSTGAYTNAQLLSLFSGANDTVQAGGVALVPYDITTSGVTFIDSGGSFRPFIIRLGGSNVKFAILFCNSNFTCGRVEYLNSDIDNSVSYKFPRSLTEILDNKNKYLVGVEISSTPRKFTVAQFETLAVVAVSEGVESGTIAAKATYTLATNELILNALVSPTGNYVLLVVQLPNFGNIVLRVLKITHT